MLIKDIWFNIFLWCDFNTILSINLVNTSLNSIFKSYYFWIEYYKINNLILHSNKTKNWIKNLNTTLKTRDYLLCLKILCLKKSNGSLMCQFSNDDLFNKDDIGSIKYDHCDTSSCIFISYEEKPFYLNKVFEFWCHKYGHFSYFNMEDGYTIIYNIIDNNYKVKIID